MLMRWLYRPFFTFCFIPIIPLACKKYKLVACPICHFKQDLSARPDVQSQNRNGGGPPPGPMGPQHGAQQQQYPQHGGQQYQQQGQHYAPGPQYGQQYK